MTTPDRDAIPGCPGPDPHIRKPRLAPPAGACDCHAHVFGPADRHPYAPDRSYTPPDASPEAYFHVLDTLGLARGVLVQPSVYGTDNRRMVEVMRAHPDRLRGVAVVDAVASERELRDLADAGVRGVRLNLLYRGGVGIEQAEALARRIAPFGWHLQFLLDARILPDAGPRLMELPVPIVIDHLGHLPTDAGVHHPGFQALLGMLRMSECWVKLSGAYRVSTEGPPYHDTLPFARELAAAAPERMVWATDWPHPAVTGPMPNDGDLLDLLALWVPDEDRRRAILVDNPAQLYGFEALK